MQGFKRSSSLLLACSLVTSPLVLALGVGNAEINSSLGEPVSIRIPIYGAEGLYAEQVLVSLQAAWDESTDSELGGVSVNEMEVSSDIDSQGSGFIWIRGQERAAEPFVNFTLQLRWPNGSLNREYTLLLDFPQSTPPGLATPAKPVVTAAAPKASNTAGEAVNKVTTAFADSGPMWSKPEFYVSQRGDSLWRIARIVNQQRGEDLKTVMAKIFNANPQAFVRGAPEKLKVSVRLDISDSALSAASTTMPLARKNKVANKAADAVVNGSAPAAVDGAGDGAGMTDRSSQPGEQLSAPAAELVAVIPGRPQELAGSHGVADADTVSVAQITALQNTVSQMSLRLATMTEEIAQLKQALAEVTEGGVPQPLPASSQEALSTPNSENSTAVSPDQNEMASLAATPGQVSASSRGLLAVIVGLLVAIVLLLRRRKQDPAQAEMTMSTSSPVAEAPQFTDLFGTSALAEKSAIDVAAVEDKKPVESEFYDQGEIVLTEPQALDKEFYSENFDFEDINTHNDDNTLPSLKERAELCRQLDDLDGAKMLLESALQLAPENEDVQMRLLEIYAELGDSGGCKAMTAQLNASAMSMEKLDAIARAKDILNQRNDWQARG